MNFVSRQYIDKQATTYTYKRFYVHFACQMALGEMRAHGTELQRQIIFFQSFTMHPICPFIVRNGIILILKNFSTAEGNAHSINKREYKERKLLLLRMYCACARKGVSFDCMLVGSVLYFVAE